MYRMTKGTRAGLAVVLMCAALATVPLSSVAQPPDNDEAILREASPTMLDRAVGLPRPELIDPTVERSRLVEVNTELILDRSGRTDDGRPNETQLTLTLFDDVEVRLAAERIEVTGPDSLTLAATVTGPEQGTAVLVLDRGDLTGSLRVGDHTYVIQPVAPGLHSIQEVIPGPGADEEPVGQAEPPIEISTPREGDRLLTPTYSIDVAFTVTSESPLVRVTAEVLGADTGVFFTICGDGQVRCTGKPPTYGFSLSVPVFAGDNTLKIVATHRPERTSEVSRDFYVAPFVTEPVGLVRPPMQAALPVAELVAEEDMPYDPSMTDRDRYDLLILTQSKKTKVDGVVYLDGFGKILLPLVAHKNRTGMPTIMLTLEDLYETPKYRGRDHARSSRMPSRTRRRRGVSGM